MPGLVVDEEIEEVFYHYADSRGDTCQDYADNAWCTSYGQPGSGWSAEWGTLADYADEYGYAPTDACCACGGGCNDMPGYIDAADAWHA